MFDLEFGDELGSLVEAVLHPQHEAPHVELGILRRLAWAGVVDLAVTRQHRGGRLGTRRLGGGHHSRHRRGSLLLLLLLLQGGELGSEFTQFGGQAFKAASQFGLGSSLGVGCENRQRQGARQSGFGKHAMSVEINS